MSRFLLRLNLHLLFLSALFMLLLIPVAQANQSGITLLVDHIERTTLISTYVDVNRAFAARPRQRYPALETGSGEWSPQGDQVISLTANRRQELFVVGSDSRIRQITSFRSFLVFDDATRPNRRSNIYPSWSPDGVWISFISGRISGQIDLLAIRPDGEDLRMLIRNINTRTPLRPRWVFLETTSTADYGLAALVMFVGRAIRRWFRIM